MTNIIALSGTLVSILAFLGAGHILLKIFFPKIPDSKERILYAFLMGIAGIAVLIFVLGVTGFLNRYIIWLFSLAIVLLKRGYIVTTIKRMYSYATRILLKQSTAWEKILLSAILLMILLHAVTALVPVYTRDEMRHNAEIPRRYLEMGKIAIMENNRHSFMPRYFDMVFTYERALGNERSANLFSVLQIMLISMTIFLLSLKFSSRIEALGAVVLFIYLGETMFSSSVSRYDMGWAIFQLASVLALYLYLRDNTYCNAILSAVFAGFAIGCKFPAAPSALVLWLIILFWKHPHKKSLVLIYPVVVVLMVLPWIIFFWSGLGNPVWPFLKGIFPNTKFDQPFIAEYLSERYDYGHLFKRTFLNFFLLPFFLTFRPQNHFNCSGATAPFFIIGFPYYAWLKRREYHVKFLSSYSFLVLIAWYLSSTQLRFAFCFLAIASIFTANGVYTMIKKGYLNRWVVGFFVLFYILCGLFGKLYLTRYVWPYITARESQAQFLRKSLASEYGDFFNYDDYQWMNKNLPENAIVVTEVSDKVYYLNRRYVDWRQIEFYVRKNKETGHFKAYKHYAATHIYTYEKKGKEYLKLVRESEDSRGKAAYLYKII